MPLSYNELKALINRAEGNYTFYDEENEEQKKLEAFLLQTVLLEGVIVKLALTYIEKIGLDKLVSKRKNQIYTINNAIDDLYLMKKINSREYNKLQSYKKARNRFVHHLLDKDFENIDRESNKIYENGKAILLNMVGMLKRNI